MKLALGAAQFGLDYGISNSKGITEFQELEKCLQIAAKNLVNTIDTAPAYGNSEDALGRANAAALGFRIITKTNKGLRPGALRASVEASLRRLKCGHIHGLLFHDSADILTAGQEALMAEALALKELGLVKKIGVSVYNGSEIDDILRRFDVDIIQLPINMLDQRLLKSGHLKRLKDRNVEIHARSVFLQGLLLMNPDQLDPYFSSVQAHLKRNQEVLRQHGVTPIEACLHFALEIQEIDQIVCGINNSGQLEELLSICSGPALSPRLEFDHFSWEDPMILNPSKWKLSKGQK